MAHSKSGKKAKPSANRAAAPAPSQAAAGPRSQGRMVAVICAVLALACFAIYGRTLSHEFVSYDDGIYVTDNPHVQAGLHLKTIGWAFVTDRAFYFHPLTWMSHMLDCSLYGMRPWGHHLTNLILHTAASVLLFLALRLLAGVLWPSAMVAALFAVHPLHVESVAWIAERKDVLSALFWMLALGAYGLYVRRGGAVRYAAVAAAFVLGLMSKPMVVTLPFVLLLLDYWPLDQVDRTARLGDMAGRMARLALWKTPLFLITLISCVSTYVMQVGGNNLAFGEKVPFADRCANAVVVYVLYLVKTIWPSGLAAFYPHPISRPMWQVAGAALVLAAITLFCLREARRRPYLIVGWLWYLGALVPVIELVQAGDFSHADRYTYLPSIGIFIMAAWGVADLAAAWHVPGRALAAASGAALAALTVCAVVQAGYWRDTETLFRHAIDVGQRSGLAYNNLGTVAMSQKHHDEAKAHFAKALELDPRDVRVLNNLGRLALNEDRYDDAGTYLTKALELKPDLVAILNNLGELSLKQGRHDEAKAYLTKSLNLAPENVATLNYLGALAINQGRHDEAEPYLTKALDLQPDFADALDNLVLVAPNLGHHDKARAYLMKALELNPGNVNALKNFGKLALNQGRHDEARTYLTKALELDPKCVPALNNLGGCCLEQGQYEEAQRCFRKALEVDPQNVPALNNLADALAKLGRQEEAGRCLQKAAELQHARAAK